MQFLDWLKKSSVGRLVLIVWITAFFSRSIWFFLPRGHGGSEFYFLAMNVLHGHGFSMSDSSPYLPVTIRGPGYPFFIVFIFKLFGIESDIPFEGGESNILFMSQFFFDSLNSVLVFFLGRLLLNRAVAFLGGMVCALHPYASVWNTSYSHYFLCALFLLLGIFAFSKQLKQFLNQGRYSIKYIALCGFFLALGALVRPEFLYFPAVLLGILFLLKKFRYAVRTSLLVLLFFSLTIAPWIIRNYCAKESFIPIADGLVGELFFIATEPLYNQKLYPSGHHHTEFAKKYPMVLEYEGKFIEPAAYASGDQSFTEINRQLMQMGFENIKKRPLGYILSRIKELPYLWIESGNYVMEVFMPDFSSEYSWERLLKNPFSDWKTVQALFFKTGGLFLFYLLPYSLAFLGVCKNRNLWMEFLILLSIPAFITLIHLPLWISHHYSIPGLPYLFLLSGLGIESMLKGRQTRYD